MSKNEQSGDNLAAINSATLGTNMPIVTLPNGEKIQTGTIGALLINIKAYDELIRQKSEDGKEKFILEAKMATSMPVLKKAGIFDLFTPEEWVQGTSPGRRFVGELAIKEGLGRQSRADSLVEKMT